MVKSWQKFINKSNFKDEINNIIKDISENKLDNYYVRKLSGYKNYYRIRVGKIRIVFEKNNDGNYIVAVDTRGQIYKSI